MVGIAVIFMIGVIGLVAWLISRVDKSESNSTSYYNSSDSSDKLLPNGYTRGDYHERSFSDADIDVWGLDMPGAPDPDSAGWVVMDMADGDFDGEIDF